MTTRGELDILIQDSWLREYLDTNATARDIQRCLSLCGPSVEKIEEVDGETIYHIEITTNRVTDSASVKGIAREAAAILPRFGFKARFKNGKDRHPDTIRYGASSGLSLRYKNRVGYLDVKIQNYELCPRFTTVLLRNVHIKSSSEKIVKRLERNGMRGLNNIVDITNYIMIETGQPAHAFDYDEIKKHKMLIRDSKQGETVVTLDKINRKLPAGSIVIEDGEGRLIDLCGIMGTYNSSTKSNSRNILLFTQTYDPARIRKTCQTISFRTDAASLFEKWVDPDEIPFALQRAVELIIQEANPEKIEDVIDIYPLPIKPKTVVCPLKKLHEYATEKIDDELILQILNSLGIKSQIKGQRIVAKVPSFRARDIEIPEDIIEEVVRIYGYHNLKGRLPTGDLPEAIFDNNRTYFLQVEKKIKDLLKEAGLTEIYTSSMIAKSDLEKINYSSKNIVNIQNPLDASEEIMRPTLLPSLLKVIGENMKRESEINLFEMSNVYAWNKPRNLDTYGKDLPEERMMLGIISVGQKFEEIKGKLEWVFKELGIIIVATWDRPGGQLRHYPPRLGEAGSEASLSLRIGQFGSINFINSVILQKFNIFQPVIYVEFDVQSLISAFSQKKKIKLPGKFPEAFEDLALLIPKGIYFADIEETIRAQSSLISRIEILDEYNKFTTIRVVYQSDTRNIEDADIKVGRERILKELKNKYKILLKK